MLTSGWIIDRKACGRITRRRDWVNVRPMARAASACPIDTVLMPVRTASLTKAALNSASPITSEPGGSGSGDRTQLRRCRRVAFDDGADGDLPELRPAAVVVDLLQPRVDELLRRRVGQRHPDAVRIHRERRADHLDRGIV